MYGAQPQVGMRNLSTAALTSTCTNQLHQFGFSFYIAEAPNRSSNATRKKWQGSYFAHNQRVPLCSLMTELLGQDIEIFSTCSSTLSRTMRRTSVGSSTVTSNTLSFCAMEYTACRLDGSRPSNHIQPSHPLRREQNINRTSSALQCMRVFKRLGLLHWLTWCNERLNVETQVNPN